MKRTLQPSSAEPQQSRRRAHVGHRAPQVGAYTIAQILERISMSRRTFFRLRELGQLPFLEEVQPRLGRLVRYRADLIDQYVAGDFQRHGRNPKASVTASHNPLLG